MSTKGSPGYLRVRRIKGKRIKALDAHYTGTWYDVPSSPVEEHCIDPLADHLAEVAPADVLDMAAGDIAITTSGDPDPAEYAGHNSRTQPHRARADWKNCPEQGAPSYAAAPISKRGTVEDAGDWRMHMVRDAADPNQRALDKLLAEPAAKGDESYRWR